MATFKFPHQHLNQPLGTASLLDESDYFAVRDSVEELQMIMGDDTSLTGLSTQELLRLQERLQKIEFPHLYH